MWVLYAFNKDWQESETSYDSSLRLKREGETGVLRQRQRWDDHGRPRQEQEAEEVLTRNEWVIGILVAVVLVLLFIGGLRRSSEVQQQIDMIGGPTDAADRVVTLADVPSRLDEYAFGGMLYHDPSGNKIQLWLPASGVDEVCDVAGDTATTAGGDSMCISFAHVRAAVWAQPLP